MTKATGGSAMSKAAVVLIIFKRADTTQRVFEAIKAYQPEKLYIVADGPRRNVPGEVDACTHTRAVVEKIDWACQVIRIYSEENLGSRTRIQTGLDEVFKSSDSAIILEDDCLPDGTFFTYANQMLDLYQHDRSVGMISGNNFLWPASASSKGHYLSALPHIWGWATWKRSWDLYEKNAESWPTANKNEILRKAFFYSIYRSAWKETLDKISEIDAWDFQWCYSLWKNDSLSVVPKVNLVHNLGLNEMGTNTLSPKSHFQNKLGFYNDPGSLLAKKHKRSRLNDAIELTVFRIFAARHMSLADWIAKLRILN